MAIVSFHRLPQVSLWFAIIQVLLYFFSGCINIKKEEDVYVSWKSVVTDGEWWRLLCAQLFHFGRVHIFISVASLMALGKYLEKKITPVGLISLIMLMSVVSNILYIMFNDFLCTGPYSEYTLGFSTVIFALRMVHVFTLDSKANNGKGEPNFLFGFIPIYLPYYIAPWHPILETIFFDVAILGRCVAANVSGICAGLVFPYIAKNFRGIMLR